MATKAAILDNGRIKAILNLYVTLTLPIKFRLNATYGLVDVVWRISRWLAWGPSWIWERNDFSNSQSPCHSSNFGSIWPMVWEEMSFEEFQDGRLGDHLGYWEEMSFEEFQDGRLGDHLGYWNKTILAIFWISVSLWCLPSSFGSIQLKVWVEMSLEEFQNGQRGHHLGYRNWMFLATLALNLATMPPTKFQFNITYGSEGDVKNVKS